MEREIQHLSSALHKKLKEKWKIFGLICEIKGTSRTKVITEFVEEWLKKPENKEAFIIIEKMRLRK